jgi:hypothetical protein
MTNAPADCPDGMGDGAEHLTRPKERKAMITIGWVEPSNLKVQADYELTRRDVDAAPGYETGRPNIHVTYRWNGRDAWISGYREGIQRREPILVCLHSNNGWRLVDTTP